MTTSLLQVRAARDRVIDLSGFGQTYPIRELTVRDEGLIVPFNQTAKISIEDSQIDVLYQLHFDQEPVWLTQAGTRWVSKASGGTPIEAPGNGGTLILETYPIDEDITFEIYAKKLLSDRDTYLWQKARIRVGLDISLRARIRRSQDVTLLDPALDPVTDEAPRLIDYGHSVEVEIENSQEGVDYELVTQPDPATILSVASVRGDLHNITLTSKPIYEDTDIYIRATKTFDPSENRDTQIALLTAMLPLKVRANPDLAVSVDPEPIIGYNQATSIKLTQTQASVSYQLYRYPLLDRDFIYQASPPGPILSVDVPNEEPVQVQEPVRGDVWTTPPGYSPVDGAQAGTGGDLSLPLPPLTEDSLIIVRAQKEHLVSSDTGQTISTAIQLAHAALVLTKPDPAPSLRVVLTPGTNNQLQVFDGQAGVFYYFHLAPEDAAISLPAYFHQQDDVDASQNKGLGQLRLEGDFVVAREPEGVSDDLAHTPPAPPILETTSLTDDVTLHVRAVKARTRVATWLDQTIGPE